MKLRMVSSLIALAACAGGSPPRTETSDHALASAAVELEIAASTKWAASHERDLALEQKLVAVIESGLASHDNAVVTAHALVQWSRLVRRRLHEPMHSAVPGVTDDPDCAGSVIGDKALIGYVAALEGEDVTKATVSLQALARHLACLGERQTSELATAMVIAYDDLATTLDRNGRADALPYVAQAIAQPMLLVQDVERQHGGKAPLARWFRDHAKILTEGAGGLHHPARWHGLWLYDRTMGRLVGFKVTPTEARASENSVDLRGLYATLARATLADNACSLSEMVHRGRAKDGTYWCRGQACAQLDSPDCHAGLSRDVDQDAGGGGLAMVTPALSTTEVMACVASQVVKPGQRQMQCVLEASGHGASPYENLVKQLSAVSLAGVKLGKGCELSVIVSGAAGDYYGAREQAARDRYDQEVAAARQEMHDRNEALIKAQHKRDDAFDDFGANSPEGQAAQAELDAAEEAVNQGLLTYDQTIADAAAARDAELEAVQKEREQDAANTAESGTQNNQTQHCDPDVGGAACGNGCGAMAQQAAAFAKCFADDPTQLDPYRDGCGYDCDPSEPTAELPASAACLANLDTTTPAAIQARECWSSRCASSAANDGCCGVGGHVTTGSPSLPDLCNVSLCDPGTAASLVGGSCGCGGSYDVPDGAGGSQVPYGPLWP